MKHMCEECNAEMYMFSGEEGDYRVTGYSCDGCGWSFDTERDLTPAGAERLRLSK